MWTFSTYQCKSIWLYLMRDFVYLTSIRTCYRISELSLNFISKLVINNTSDVSISYNFFVFLSDIDFSLVSLIDFLVIHLLIKLFYILCLIYSFCMFTNDDDDDDAFYCFITHIFVQWVILKDVMLTIFQIENSLIWQVPKVKFGSKNNQMLGVKCVVIFI